MKKLLSVLAFVLSACGPIPIPPQPPLPPDPPAVTLQTTDMVACDSPFDYNYCAGAPGATFTITPQGMADSPRVQGGDSNGYTLVQGLPDTWKNAALAIRADGYEPFDTTVNIPGLVANNANVLPSGDHAHNAFQLKKIVPPLPPPPTRSQVLNMHITGQGLIVNTQQFGTLPWWEAALTYLNSADRATVYAAKHASTAWSGGDTHAIIAVPSGRALYDEPDQPYSADRFPPLDWTNSGTKMSPQFAALVFELIQNKFIPMIFLDETFDTSNKTLPVVIDALQHSAYGDLTPYVIIGPGWDGVFYGWEPSHVVIPAWAAAGRAKCPKCYFFIEHNVGHIPLGEGPSDWTPTGLMKDFDLLLSEFWDGVFDDSVWQIAGRTIRPYHRPAEQPTTDDPNPPFYLEPGSPRGPFLACAFEFAMYGFVRSKSTPAQVQSWRQYFKDRGYTCGG